MVKHETADPAGDFEQSSPDVIEQLEKLQSMRETGVIDEDEFRALKTQLIA